MDLSIVISLYNEDESLRELVEWIDRAIAQSPIAGIEYEILMIDDGSDDGSWNTIKELSVSNPHIRAYSFRRNYGKSAALQTGFREAAGDVVITMDADLRRVRSGLWLEKSTPRQHIYQEHPVQDIQLHRPQGHRPQAARHELRPQGVPQRGGQGDRGLWRHAPLHPLHRQECRVHPHRREGGGTPQAQVRKKQVRHEPLLQRLPRPDDDMVPLRFRQEAHAHLRIRSPTSPSSTLR